MRAALVMSLLAAACVSASMRIPPGHPARPDTRAPEPAEPAMILTSTAAVPKLEPVEEVHPHHEHGAH